MTKRDDKLHHFFTGKTVLVTGGSGFIGSALTAQLAKFPCRVVLPKRGSDIRKIQFWQDFVKRDRVDIIFHLAAQTSLTFASSHPLADLSTNLLPIVRLVELCQASGWKPTIIFAGTVTQAGLTKNLPVNESIPDRPITVYDLNKLAAEKYLQYYSRQLGGQAVTLRLSNIYGPGPTSQSQERGIVNLLIKKALAGETLSVFGTGNYIRDYLFITDAVEAFIKACVYIKDTNGNYYVLGTGIGHTIKEMAEGVADTVARQTGIKVDIKLRPWPLQTHPIEKRNFIADTKAFTRATGWKAKVNFETGVRQTVAYFLQGKKS